MFFACTSLPRSFWRSLLFEGGMHAKWLLNDCKPGKSTLVPQLALMQPMETVWSFETEGCYMGHTWSQSSVWEYSNIQIQEFFLLFSLQTINNAKKFFSRGKWGCGTHLYIDSCTLCLTFEKTSSSINVLMLVVFFRFVVCLTHCFCIPILLSPCWKW